MDFILFNYEKEVIYQEHCVHCVIFFKTLNFSCVENTGSLPQLLRPLTVNRFACMQAYVRFLLTTPFPHTVLYCTIGSFMSGWVSEWVRKGRGGRELVSECKFSLGQDALFLIDLGLQKRYLDQIILKYGIWSRDLLLFQFFSQLNFSKGVASHSGGTVVQWLTSETKIPLAVQHS